MWGINSKYFQVLNELTSSKSLFKTLPYFSARFQDINRYCFLADTSQNVDNIHIPVQFNFSQKLSYVVSWYSWTTGSSSSEFEHRRTSALLRNIRNIRICMGKKTYRWCNLRKWKDFHKKKKKKQLSLHKMCVTSLLCAPGPIYGRFMDCTVNGFLSV